MVFVAGWCKTCIDRVHFTSSIKMDGAFVRRPRIGLYRSSLHFRCRQISLCLMLMHTLQTSEVWMRVCRGAIARKTYLVLFWLNKRYFVSLVDFFLPHISTTPLPHSSGQRHFDSNGMNMKDLLLWDGQIEWPSLMCQPAIGIFGLDRPSIVIFFIFSP